MVFLADIGGSIALYLFVLVSTLAIMSSFFVAMRRKPLVYLVGVLLYGIVAIVFAVEMGRSIFQIMNLAAMGIFLGGPVVLLMAAYFASTGKLKLTAYSYLFLALLTVSVGIDAFLVEPHLLESTHMTVTSSKIKRPLKLAVVSDLQTDKVCAYDEDALKKVLAEKPDIILMPGDYVQCLTEEKQDIEMARFRGLLERLHFSAPLGVYAVRGNSEGDNWPVEFAGTGVKANDSTTLYELPDLDITGLSFGDSFNSKLHSKADQETGSTPRGKFHIIFGHGPDFALSHPPGDLLIAGHTHGGQVRLPFIGPIITLSAVSREWAAGRTQIDPDTTLIVSRGVGMERNYAPRLRFLCRPQLIFIDLQPAAAAAH